MSRPNGTAGPDSRHRLPTRSSHDLGVVPVYGPQDGVTPRFVTCGGAFDSSIGHYVDNVIAFATLAA